jgi:hypothetical protein
MIDGHNNEYVFQKHSTTTDNDFKKLAGEISH